MSIAAGCSAQYDMGILVGGFTWVGQGDLSHAWPQGASNPNMRATHIRACKLWSLMDGQILLISLDILVITVLACSSRHLRCVVVLGMGFGLCAQAMQLSGP